MNANLSLEPAKPNPEPGITLRNDITPQEYRASEINEALIPAYKAAGTLKMTPEEITKLTAPFPRSCMEKKMGKFLYIPHIFVSQRLTQVFGPGQWTMIRRQEKMSGNQIMCEWIMVVRGVFIGESWGAQDYHPNNPNQTYADVVEATRGECIRRIAGKYLSCGGEAWEPEVQRQMSLASARERLETPRPAPAPIAPPIKQHPLDDELKAKKAELWALLKPRCKTVEDAGNWLKAYKIIPDEVQMKDLTEFDLDMVIEKTKIQLKDMA